MRLSSVVISSTHTPITMGETRTTDTLSGRKEYSPGIRVLIAKKTLRNENPKEKKPLKGLCSIFKGRDWTEVELLQKLDTSIKGCGTILLYNICKMAKKAKHKHIELFAPREEVWEYYKKLGFTNFRINKSKFILTNDQFDTFLNNIETKYLN